MTLLYSTKRDPTCQPITYQDFQAQKKTLQAFRPSIHSSLYELQMTDETLQAIQTFRNTNQWPQTIPRQDQAYYTTMIDKLFQDKNKVVWVRLNDFSYPRTALYLPTRYWKEAMCKTHDSILGGHNAAHKTYLKISTSYFWPKMKQDIECHQNFCLRCQQRKKSTNKRTPFGATPNSGTSKPPDSCRSFWPNAHSGQ